MSPRDFVASDMVSTMFSSRSLSTRVAEPPTDSSDNESTASMTHLSTLLAASGIRTNRPVASSTLAIRKKKQQAEAPFRKPDEMVTFKVGPAETTFLVHKTTACSGSPIFEAAFNGVYEEGQTQTYKLPDVTAETFRYFSEWLYSQKLTLLDHDNITEEEKSSNVHYDDCAQQDFRLVELWTLGDRFDVEGLQDYVVSHLVSIGKTCGTLNSACLRHLYEYTSTGSPLRRFVVDQYAWASEEPFSSLTSYLPHNMLVEIADVYRQAAPSYLRDRKARQMSAEDYFISD